MSRAIPAFAALLVSISLLLTACKSQPAPVAETALPPEPAPAEITAPTPTAPATEPAPAQEPEAPAQETAPPEPTLPPPEASDTPAPDATTPPMPRGTPDPDLEVTVYQPDKAWTGTTLLPDNHNTAAPRIIEVNMLGEIIWECRIPSSLRQYTNPGFDVEPLENGHILYVLPGKGVYEIERSGNVVWSYLTSKISHDADRLPNGNTIFAFGNEDKKSDAQVTEVSPDGTIVWQWHAADHFDAAPYADIERQGWTHTNAVTRMGNGNTLISPRNFDFMVEVGPDGEVVATYGEGIVMEQHDPEVLPDGHILVASHNRPQRVVEIDPATGKVVWQSPPFGLEDIPVRDANRLPNGNTLITTSTRIIEVTATGEIVWELSLGMTFTGPDAAGLGFYKAERIGVEG